MELEFKVKDNQFFNVKEIIKSQFQISDRLLVKLKREKRIFLNGKPVYVTEKVKIGDVIKLDMNFDEASDNIVPTKMDLNIIFKDDYFLVITKLNR